MTTKKDEGLYQVPIRYNNIRPSNFSKPLDRKIFFAISLMIEKNLAPQLDLSGQVKFEIPTAILGRPREESLKDSFLSLMSPMLLRETDKEDSLGVKLTTWSFFSKIEYRRGKVIAHLSQDGYRYLTEFTRNDGYFWAHLKAGLSLSSNYSQHWYTLFCQYLNFGVMKNITIDKIIELHSISDDLFINKKTGKRKNSDLINWVVYKPIKEINEKTNLRISYSFIQDQKRPILGFHFKIESQEPGSKQNDLYKIEDYVNKLRNQFGSRGLTEKIHDLISEYSISDENYEKLISSETLLNKVIDVSEKIDSGKIKIKVSKSSYMQKIILDTEMKIMK